MPVERNIRSRNNNATPNVDTGHIKSTIRLAEGLSDVLKAINAEGEKFTDIIRKVGYVNIDQLIKELNYYKDLLRDNNFKLRDLINLYALFDKINKILIEGERRKLITQRESIKTLEAYKHVHAETIRNIKRQYRNDTIKEFFSSLSSATGKNKEHVNILNFVNSITSKVLGYALPMTVLDAVAQITKFIRSLDRATVEMNRTLAPAFVQTAALSRYNVKQLEASLKSFGSLLQMSAKDMAKTFVEVRESGLLYTTNMGKAVLNFQRTLDGSAASTDEFSNGLKLLNVMVKGLADATGRTNEEVVRFMSSWRPMLFARDIQNVQKAFATLYAYSIRTGLGYQKLNSILTDILNTERMYGISLGSLLPAVEKLKVLFQDNVITVNEFKEALRSAKGEISPENAGSALYFLANFANRPEVKNFANALLKMGGEGILVFQQFMRTRVNELRSSWDYLTVEQRRQFMELFNSLGMVKNGMIDWNGVTRTQLALQRELYNASFNLAKQIGGGAGSTMYLYGELNKVVGRNTDDFLKLSRMQVEVSEVLKNFRDTLDLGTKAQEDYNEVIGKGKEVFEKSISAIGEAAAGFWKLYQSIVREVTPQGRNISVPEPSKGFNVRPLNR